MTDAKTKVLRETFGFEQFRKGQSEIIDCVLDPSIPGVLVIMPTGGGKSLLFQIPSIVYGGINIVVSPLISLMKDQVDTLQSKGVEAYCFNSSLSKKDKDSVRNAIQMGIVDILYVAPERFEDNDFTEMLANEKINVFAVDEAHSISTWGHDFRPSYTKLKGVIDKLCPTQVVALTATATPKVQDDICEQLGMKKAKRFINGFYRDNLILKIDDSCKGNARIDKIVKKVNSYHKKGIYTGIIYTGTRKNAENICGRLNNFGVETTFYHGGMKDKDRKEIQDKWAKNGGTIVATCAFGMGIDRPDVRFVIHANMPGNIESWYQEIGRAGRDGKPSVCQMYFSYGEDMFLQRFFIDMSNPPPEDVEKFWHWLNSEALEHDQFNGKVLIKMTQNEMAEQSGINPAIIGACIGILKKNNIVKTIGRGQYEVTCYTKAELAPINYGLLKLKREEKTQHLQNMVRFINDKTKCRFKNILTYFGYKMVDDCGKCDWCQRRDGRM